MRDSTVVIIGGTSGIGLATAHAAAAAGAEVVIVGRDEQRLQAARSAVPGSRGIRADMTDRPSLDALFAEVGALDHLLITAAELQGGTFTALQPSDMHVNFDTRFWGSIAATQAAIPFLSPQGSVTFTSGVAAHRPFPGESVGGASSAAVESLARSLSIELAPLRFNALAPVRWTRRCCGASWGTTPTPSTPTPAPRSPSAAWGDPRTSPTRPSS